MSKLRTIFEREGHIFAVRRSDSLEVLFVDGVEIGVAFERTQFYHTVVAPRGELAWFTRKQQTSGGYTVCSSREIPADTLKRAVERYAIQYCNELTAKAEAENVRPENMAISTFAKLSVHKVESVPHLYAIRCAGHATDIAFVHIGEDRYVRANTPTGIIICDGLNRPIYSINAAIASLTDKDIEDGLANPWSWESDLKRPGRLLVEAEATMWQGKPRRCAPAYLRD